MLYMEDFDEWEYNAFEYKSYDPALPSYVASLLVAKVRSNGLNALRKLEQRLTEWDGATACASSPDEIIEACLMVLGEDYVEPN